MTCIVGYVDDAKNVWIGGDSAGVGNYDVIMRRDPKVFRNGPYLMGFTSSFRMGQLLRFGLTVPRQEEDHSDEQHMMTTFVDAVRKCLSDGGFAKTESGNESGGTFVVGYRGSLYVVYDDYQVSISAETWVAVGCGEGYALGALKAMEGSDTPASQRVTRALEIAAHYSAGVRAPFVVESL